MLYNSETMENQALLQAAAQMCAVARTAPKARGIDEVLTLVLTGEEKNAVADKMEEMADNGQKEENGGWLSKWFQRDAENLRKAQAVVLIGTKKGYRGTKNCGFCGFKDCNGCKEAGGTCFLTAVDLGIALASACAAAADLRIDNRIMFSIGKAAMEMEFGYGDVIWQGIPLSITGKNVFFDR